MAVMLRISEAGALGLHATVLLASEPQRCLTISEMARALGVSANHLAKVMQRLARAGLVHSVRGRKGGFVAGERGTNLSLLAVYEAIEGRYQPGDCLLRVRICRRQRCILGDLLEQVNRQFRDYLARRHVGELAGALAMPDRRCRSTPRQRGTASRVSTVGRQ